MKMKIRSAITLKDKIIFYFDNETILTIRDNGISLWTVQNNCLWKKIVSDSKSQMLFVLSCSIILDCLCVLAPIYLGSFLYIILVLEWILLLVVIHELYDKNTTQRHAVEHILIKAYDEGRPLTVNIEDRFSRDCGMRFAVYIVLFLATMNLFVGFTSVTIVLIMTFVTDYCLKNWKYNPFVSLSLLLQRFTTKIPHEDFLNTYQKTFIKAIFSKRFQQAYEEAVTEQTTKFNHRKKAK